MSTLIQTQGLFKSYYNEYGDIDDFLPLVCTIQVQNHLSINVSLSWPHTTLDIDHNVEYEYVTFHDLSSSISDGGKGDGHSRRVVTTGNAAIELHDSNIDSGHDHHILSGVTDCPRCTCLWVERWTQTG